MHQKHWLLFKRIQVKFILSKITGVLMEQLIDSIYQAVLDGDMKNASAIVQKAIAEGNSADQILQNGLIPAMAEAGRLFENGEYFVIDKELVKEIEKFLSENQIKLA